MVAMVANFSRLIFITSIICKNFNLYAVEIFVLLKLQFSKHLPVCVYNYLWKCVATFSLSRKYYILGSSFDEDAFPRLAVNKKLYESCT
jgi:hypothetical protein